MRTGMKLNIPWIKWALVTGVLVAAFVLFKFFNLSSYISLNTVQTHEEALRRWIAHYYIYSVFVFCALTTLAVTASLPIVWPLAVIGGYLFGWFAGALYTDIGTTLGVVGAYLIIKHITGHNRNSKYTAQLNARRALVEKYGSLALLALQLSCVVPLFVINLTAVATRQSIWAVVWTTMIGSLPMIIAAAVVGFNLSTTTQVAALAPVVVTFLHNLWSHNIAHV